MPDQAIAAFGYGFEVLRIAAIILKYPPQIANGSGQQFIGSDMSTPDGLKQLIPADQLIGMFRQADEHIHHLGLKVLGLVICPGDGSPKRFNRPWAETKSLLKIIWHCRPVVLMPYRKS